MREAKGNMLFMRQTIHELTRVGWVSGSEGGLVSLSNRGMLVRGNGVRRWGDVPREGWSLTEFPACMLKVLDEFKVLFLLLGNCHIYV